MNTKYECQYINQYDGNYCEVIYLYKKVFSGENRIPMFLLRYKLRKGKEDFNVPYENDVWFGLIYT